MTKYFFLNVLVFMLLGFTLSSYGLSYNTAGYWICLGLGTVIYMIGFGRALELQANSTAHKDRDRPL